jgi:hypothetical protein
LAYQYRRTSGSARTQIEAIAREIAEELIEETKSSSAARQPAQPVQA